MVPDDGGDDRAGHLDHAATPALITDIQGPTDKSHLAADGVGGQTALPARGGKVDGASTTK